MKKHLLFNQLFGTVGSPNQTGETLTRENRIGLMSYLRRTLMLLFAVLVMSIANIGMAWGTEYSSTPLVSLDFSSSLPTVSGVTYNGASYSSGKISWTGNFDASSRNVQITFTTTGSKFKLVLGHITSGSSMTFKYALDGGSATNLSMDKTKTSETYEISASAGSHTIKLGPAGTSTRTVVTSIAIYDEVSGSTWYVKGGWNSWGTTDNLIGSGTELSATVNITTADLYEFKIWNSDGDTWYGNTGNIGCNVSGWTFSTGESANCKFFASETGNYTFTFNTSTKELSVTYPTAQGKYYYKNTGSWGAVYVYRFKGGINNGWPGTQVVETETICGDTYYFTYADPGTTLIFDNNSGNQTGDMAASGNAGKYVAGTGSSWSAFPTYTVTYNKNGDGAGGAGSVTGSVPTDSNSPYACGSTVTVKGNTGSLALAGYTFAGWNTAANGSGASYAADATFTISANTTLYAQWELIPTYDVIYNTNGGTGGSTASQTDNHTGDQVTTRANGFTKTGYKFKWWNTAANGSGEDFYPGEKVTIASADVNLYAQWEQVESGWAYWVGDDASSSPTDITGNGVTMRLARTADYNTDLTAASTTVNATGKHAKVFGIGADDKYVEISFTDGSPINSLTLGVATKDGSSPTIAVMYSTTSDFSSGEYYFATPTVPTVAQTSKSTTSVNPDEANKYKYVRIYRKISTAVYEQTGGSGKTTRIYSIKAQKGVSCVAPTAVNITGTYHYFPGETISLTAAAEGGSGSPTTYQWYKGGTADGNIIEGATSATYTKASCTFADAGSYYCKVTRGGSCSKFSDNYDVKILHLYVNTGRNGTPYNDVDFVKVDASTARATISLGASWDYGFNIADGCNHYYGNTGSMNESDCTGWTMNVDGTDCLMRTTNGATYTFTVDYTTLTAPVVSITYPSANQAADKVIYFDNSARNWSTLHYRIGRTNHTQATAMTQVPGTANLYKVTTTAYNNFSGWHIANNAGWTGDDNSIYRTYTDGDQYSITYATAHEGGAVTESAVTVTPTTSRGMGGDAGINDNCEFYNYTITNGMKTQNVAISPYSNGTITVNYTNTSDVASTLTSGNADLAHSVILTSITAVPNTGYDAGAITINGGAYSANYVVTGATTIAATFSPHVYTITLNKGDHGAANQSATVAYHAGELTSITPVTPNTGYTLTGYYDGETKVLNADGTFAGANVTGYITDSKWTKTSNATLTAKWTAKTTTITINANTANHGSTTPGTVTATYGSALPSFTAATGASGWNLTGYFTTATSGTKVINADGTLVASTDYADGSGNWNSEAATLTLYAQYEEDEPAGDCTTRSINAASTTDLGSGNTPRYVVNVAGVGRLMKNKTGSSAWTLSNGALTTGSNLFALQTYNAISEIVIYGSGTGGNRTLSQVEVGTATNNYATVTASATVQGTDDGKFTTSGTADSMHVVFNSDVAANSYVAITFSGNVNITKVSFVSCDEPSCSTPMAPSSLTNGATTSNTQAVSWTDASNEKWDVIVSESSSTPDAGDTPTASDLTSKSYTFTGLTASTTYYWWTRSVCDASHKSAWTAGTSFTTSAAALALITYNLRINTSGTTLKNSVSTTDGTNITNIDIDQTNDGANGDGTTNRTTKLAIKTGANGADWAGDPTNYEIFKFKVACGKKLTPSKIRMKVANVGGASANNIKYKAILSDTYGHSLSGTYVVATQDGTVETFDIDNADASKYFQGEVTLKLWAWTIASKDNGGSAFRMGTPLEIYGEVANQATPAATITWNTQPANGQVGDPDFAYDVTCSDGSAVTVTSANTTYATIVGGKLHYAAAGTTHLVASATDACGNTVTPVNSNDFTVSAAAPTHDVTFSLTNVVYSSGNNQGTGAATEGSAFSTVFAASSGYSLPGTITVEIGDVEQTEGTGYTWSKATGTLTIPAAYVTGDIEVTIVGEELEGDGCEELVNTRAASASTLTTSVGSATLNSPSSQSYSGAIKLNSSGYIEVSPKAGSSFAVGDSLIVVIYNGGNGTKTTGFKIGDNSYTTDIAKAATHTFRQKLVAANIVSSKVKFERASSEGYYVSIIIKHCEDLPSCTTPTLPTLSNQTVCPGSDIAAWNAEPTNIATITGASEDVAYSWKKKGSDTELAATASFDLGSSATEGMAGTYVVTVTVSKTGYISKSASAEVDLTVTPATEMPSITASKAKVYATDEVIFTATCGSTGVTWQWYRCTNAGGTITGSCLSTTSSYTLASAPAAGTYYYKAVATGDGTHSCGTAEYVYTLVVSAANSCDKEFWFAKEGDRPTGAAAATHITGCPSGSSSASYTASIDGTNYTLTGSTGQKTGNVTIVVPADNTGTLYVVVQGSSSRTITLSKGGTQIGQETPANSTWGVFTFDDLDAGTYTLVSSGNISWAMMALKLCPTVACTDDTPTAAATNATVCAGGSITITATGYETGATFQWQKQNATTSVWENIDGATSDTYTVAPAAAEHAGNYHIVATRGCARTSNTVTIAVPSAPVFNSFTTTRRIMETQALAINDVSATDAVSYTWYKSTDATWDAGDTEIGDSRSLLKPYDGETAGSTYYVICCAANSCGTTTSSAITVSVQTLVEEDCAIAGNSGEHNTFAKTGSVSSGTYGSIAELHTNSNNKYIYYTAESGYYFAKATVNACVGNASDLPTAAYSYSTDGGANWTDQNLTGMTTAYTDHVINLPANVNAFRVGRRLGDCGTSSNTIYIHQVCFTYNENCTKTTVDPSSPSVDYEIGDSFTEPTFTVKSSGVALSPQPTITYTSSDETVATVDDDGTVNFQDKAGTVVITAAYAGDATYCDSEGSYTITVSCSDEAPKIIAADGTNIGGCNDEITLEAKKQDGTTNFSDGTYQWYRDGEAISGATGRTYTVSLTGVYSVERTSVGGCVSPSSNKATVTSESAEPEVERLTPFQYYHVDKVYAETSIMRFRHLFAVKNAGTTLEGKHFKMELSRNGGAAADVTNSNAFVMSADTVLIDMNKLYDKYEEDDELVLTCSAVDCEGNVSSIYKNTITIYVIDETPTLALICSGASGDGTRKTSNLVVGGDFLTGYNKADLCVQTGNTSFDKTQEWVLYTRLKENYIVTPVNGYAEFNKLNYEPFDILFLTDYPKASKSDAAATILDDMADLCDYRPLFTFKTHMVHKSPSKWAAKGFMAQPEVPKQSRLRLNIVCYAHPMFDDLKEVSDHIQKDANDHSQIVYTMLTGPGHESSKGMQGFPIDAAEGFVTIGLVHYDATAADDTPSDGYVTWTPGSSDVMLVAAAERQVNLEARMILFSINCGAQSKLTETGRQVVLKSLEYLLSDATITPVADCSFTFTNGAGNDWTYEQYKAKCPVCTGTIGDGKWSTAGNWGPDWILQPGKDTEVKIAAPVTVDMPHAKVRTVRILEGGSIDIPAGSGLEVGSTIRRLDGTEISPTEISDIHIGSASTGNGTLIFNNNSGDTKARVDMYSTAKADTEHMSAATSTWQYIGTPHNDIENARNNYYNSWLYQYDTGTEGWIVIPNGGPLVPFRGYCVTHPDADHTFVMNGTLAATGTVDIDIPAGKYVVVANSWVAPIDINTIEDDDMEGITDKSIYFFNTGSDTDGSGTSTVSATGDARWAAGTYVSVPIHSAPYTDGSDDHIPSMQGFYVVGGSSDGALHLDYDKHVRGQGRGSILSGRMHAPRRTAAESDEPNVLKIFARGSRYDDRLIVLEREDFTRGYDSGWDGEAWGGSDLSPMVYVTGDGREDAVSAIPEFEGTVITFKAGEDSEYRFEFTYSEDAEPLYLLDTENNTYTQVITGNAYYFTTTDKVAHSRFVLTRKNPQIATDIEPVSGSPDRGKAKKLLIEEKMFIMVNGMLYDATGKVVK